MNFEVRIGAFDHKTAVEQYSIGSLQGDCQPLEDELTLFNLAGDLADFMESISPKKSTAVAFDGFIEKHFYLFSPLSVGRLKPNRQGTECADIRDMRVGTIQDLPSVTEYYRILPSVTECRVLAILGMTHSFSTFTFFSHYQAS